MEKNINIIIIRHFKTYKDSNKNEKIKYDNGFKDSYIFVKFILDYLKANNNIKIIEFISSDQERTMTTSLFISSYLKTRLIEDKINSIKINDPIINNIIDRDPKKKNKRKFYKFFKNAINHEYDKKTLYIYITHSSVIYNIFNIIIKLCSDHDNKILKERIHSYSLSYILKNENFIEYNYNIRMIEKSNDK